MRLVEPAVPRGEVGKGTGVPGVEIADDIVDAVTSENPLGPDADVPGEQSLKPPRTDSAPFLDLPTRVNVRSLSIIEMTSRTASYSGSGARWRTSRAESASSRQASAVRFGPSAPNASTVSDEIADGGAAGTSRRDRALIPVRLVKPPGRNFIPKTQPVSASVTSNRRVSRPVTTTGPPSASTPSRTHPRSTLRVHAGCGSVELR
ncbi:hypothetical protein BJF84_10070 [Rhodococcus sp. CUA-806]|nr:hypothetical protein BJF84_10070 [Rhodococcus sp. CUA-806]